MIFPYYTIKKIKETYLKQHPNGLTDKEFDLFAETLFGEAQKLLLRGKKIQFATRYGYLVIKSRDGSRPRVVNGKAKMIVNMRETLKLWQEDKQAYMDQKKVFMNWKVVNSARWIKGSNALPNKRLLQFKSGISLKKAIKEISDKGKIYELR